MDNMLIVALMVVSCILINPFITASETKKVAAAEKIDEGDSDDNEEMEDDEEEQAAN